jgi:hypothetical protein
MMLCSAIVRLSGALFFCLSAALFSYVPLYALVAVFLITAHSFLCSFYCNTAANRWLSLRLEAIGATVTFTSAIFAVLQRGSLDAGLAALSVT